MRISVDFDNTIDLSAEDYPFPNKPNYKLIEWLKEKQLKGDKLILNTLREGTYLDIAIAYCNHLGLYFDAINNNLTDDILKWGYNPRKISTDIYIDDRSIRPEEIGEIK